MGYGTGAIMAVPGQDQRDWDFATAFGLPIIRTVRAARRVRGRGVHRRGPGDQLGERRDQPERAGRRRGQARRSSTGWWPGAAGEAQDPVQAARLAVLPAALLGRAVPDRLGRRRGRSRCPTTSCRSSCPRSTTTRPSTFDPDDANTEPEPPLSRATEWVESTWTWATGCATARDQHDAAVGGLVLVRPALPGPEQPRPVRRRRGRALLDGPGRGRPTTPAASTCTSAASSTRCCTCCTRGSGTRCCTTWATSARRSRSAGCSTRATSRRTPTPTRAASTCPPRRSSRPPTARSVSRGTTPPVRREYGKMGKSLKNVVTPDEMCERYGADTFRLYEMSMGPMDVSRPWATRDVVGSQRFLQRVWRNLVDETTGELRVSDAEPDEATLRALHKAIAGVHDDFVALHYNTAAAKLIELNNHLTKAYPGGGRAALGGRAAGADDGAADPAHRRGAVGAAGARPRRWRTGRSRWPTSATWSRRPSSTRSRSTARCARGSRWPPTPAPTRSRRPRWPTRRSSSCWPGGAPRKVIVVPGRLVNVVGLTASPR